MSTWLRNVSISSKLNIGFFIPILLMVALGMFFIVLVEKLNDSSRAVSEDALPSATSISHVNTNISDHRIAELQLILSTDAAQMDRYENAMKAELAKIRTNLDQYESLMTDKEKPVYAEFKRLWSQYLTESKLVVKAVRAGNKDNNALVLLRGESEALFEDLGGKLLQLVQINTEHANAAINDANSLQKTAHYAPIAVLTLIVLISLWLAKSISSAITIPIKDLTEASRKLASGNLKQPELSVSSKDEVGELTASFNSMLASIKDMTGQTRVATHNINTATAEILASTQEQAASTTEQAAAVQQTSATVEEINQSGTQVTQRAKQVAAAAEAASATCNAGIQAAQNTTKTMESIRDQAEAVAENIVALSEKTQAVGEIIATVNDIAEQSNLLALNAAIEAAAAGEHGARFSVVANELKNLADQSKTSTVKVRTILSDIQKGINTSVMLTEEAVKRVDSGKQQADVAERTIRQMADATVHSVQAFEQIVAATNQQQIGFEQVTIALKNIRVASQQTAAGTQQMEKAAASLNVLGQQLSKSVERYQV